MEAIGGVLWTGDGGHTIGSGGQVVRCNSLDKISHNKTCFTFIIFGYFFHALIRFSCF